ncbi:hypothetical protein C5S53_00185 [Methanophagales archaeon]|nr:hypothetical protein C5S53_00185 [Methanophagales archaeon]
MLCIKDGNKMRLWTKESPWEGSMIREGLTEEELFLAATFQAAIEDDLKEDAFWRKYIN